jgi:hypothetical protein
LGFPLPDELAQRAAEAFLLHGNKQAAADALGIPASTFKGHLKQAARRGLFGTKPVLPGYYISKETAVTDADGNVVREFIQQKPEHGEQFEMPAGHTIKGVSALLDANGHTIQQWVKTREGERSPEETAEIVKAAFERWEPSAPAIIPAEGDADRLTVYILADWHVGLFAYGKETGGPDWDLSIAKRVLMDTMREVVDQSPRSAHAIVLGLGDLLHADDARNQTARSGNVLDVDTRYSKCLETVCDLVAETCDLVARKHAAVEATFKPGNHDTNSTVGIAQALRMYFRNSEHVAVDTSPDPFYWRRFGVNLIGGTHGDKAKIPQLPLIMANRRKEDWAVATTRHFHTGHIHHDTLREEGGVHVFAHRAPVAQDAFHAGMGYLSGRSMKSYAYHAEKGAKGHSEVEIK